MQILKQTEKESDRERGKERKEREREKKGERERRERKKMEQSNSIQETKHHIKSEFKSKLSIQRSPKIESGRDPI